MIELLKLKFRQVEPVLLLYIQLSYQQRHVLTYLPQGHNILHFSSLIFPQISVLAKSQTLYCLFRLLNPSLNFCERDEIYGAAKFIHKRNLICARLCLCFHLTQDIALNLRMKAKLRHKLTQFCEKQLTCSSFLGQLWSEQSIALK